MRRLLFIFSFLSLLVVDGKAQEVEILTLEDCLRIGIDNNFQGCAILTHFFQSLAHLLTDSSVIIFFKYSLSQSIG